MIGWEILLILSVAGMFVLLVRRLPSAWKVANEEAIRTDLEPIIEAEPKSLPSLPSPVHKEQPAGAPPVALADEPILVNEDTGEQAFRSREFGRAAHIYETLLADDKTNPKFYNRLGVIYLELERFHEARDCFRAVLKLGDTVAGRYANLAMAEYALGHRLTAVRHLKRAMALAPNIKKYEELLETIENDTTG